MEFKRMKPERLSDKVIKEIQKMIEQGQLKPGDKLPSETEFATTIGVSRGILREALTILESQGYVSRKPKDGTYIRELSKKEYSSTTIIEVFKKASYMDLLEMRESLEQKIVELAIERATDEEILDIEKKVKKLSDEKDNDKGLKDQEFHLSIAILSKNTIMINFLNIYYDLIKDIASATLDEPKRLDQVIKEHMDIIEAIKNRDVEAAKEAALYHLNKVKVSIGKAKIKKDII